MLHRALEQFLQDVHWGELDVLVVDMPPGTGDVSISLGQLLPRAEAVIVTTPQPLAQEVASRAAVMAQKTGHARRRRDREHDLGDLRLGRRAPARRGARRADARQRAARRPPARGGRRRRAARHERSRTASRPWRSSSSRARSTRAAPAASRARSRSSPDALQPEEARPRLAALGFRPGDVETLAAHFLAAEAAGRPSHGLARIEWLESWPELDVAARPRRVASEPGYERWDGAGALGYLTLARRRRRPARRAARPCPSRRLLADVPDRHARLLGAAAGGRRPRRDCSPPPHRAACRHPPAARR